MAVRTQPARRQAASAARTDARLWTGCIAEFYFESRHYYLYKHFGLLPACAPVGTSGQAGTS